MRTTWMPLAAGVLCAALALAGGSAPKADASRGRELFDKRCTGCHAVDKPKVGPALSAVFGRPAGTDPKYPYSDALKQARVTWDQATLDKWLADPEAVVPGNDMPFRLENAAERADIIAYLQQLGGK